MMLEAMVASICIAGQPGCSTATNAYYESNKELQHTIKRAEKIGKKLIEGHEYVVYIIAPLGAVAAGKPATFKLSRSLNLNINVKQASIALQWNY